ncbi:Kinesin-like protein KIN-5D [Bienertia sinuspersici]
MESRRRGGGGGDVNTVSPARTPKSMDKSTRDLRPDTSNSSKNEKEKGVNVQVIVRCRPLNEDEKRLQTPLVITCNEIRREVSAAQVIASKQIDKTFTFDKVFGPTSKQRDLFDHAVAPIVNEMLDGYNCTIFAYGQTGTGKTYTMEGGARKRLPLMVIVHVLQNGEFPIDAGVIPRSVRRIFDILEDQQAEYSMKVSHLELYNEDLTDLLAPEECSKFVDDKSKKPLALMEDGKGGVFVRGLEEEIVTTADEIYKILEKGSAKRRTAETFLNKQSSRSHSIFTITIHIKEYTPEGEEMIKCGKLNLVDLAGSENINRSGAREGRAREAGEINKSLLTLGRCINALVEHSGHVPFRDSKLTRLLRDSLGGKTKTCIIATIAPSVPCLEETLSTLDYAYRAKNIKNKPEVNQKMMKSALMKDLYYEIERLKQEVYSAREKNGIYIPRDRYLQDEAEKKALTEKVEKMQLEMESKDKQLAELQELYDSEQQLSADLSNKLEMTQKKLEETENALSELEEKHRQANATIKEKEFIISNLLRSEKSLVDRAIELRTELESAASDISSLFSKIERKDKIEDGNRTLVQKFQSQLTQQLQALHKNVNASVTQQEQQLKDMEDDMQSFVSTKAEAAEELRQRLEKLKFMYGYGVKALDDLAGKLEGNSESTFGDLNSEVSKHSSAIEELFNQFAHEADTLLNGLQRGLNDQEEKIIVYAQKQREAHSRTVETTRSISKVTQNFFNTLDTHASKLTCIVEESQTVNEQKLSDLERKFEECAAKEEKQLLEKVAELLATSNARKKELVQAAVIDLRENAVSRTAQLQQEMSTMREDTATVKDSWTIYVDKTESHYLEDTSAVENGKKDLEGVLYSCLDKAKMGVQQWKDAQQSLLNLEKSNISSIDTIVKGGMEANQMLRTELSSSASSTLKDVDVTNKDLLASVDHSLQLDHDARGNLESIIAPSCKDVRELKSSHFHKISEITDHAGKCLLTEYRVDEPTCSTPRKRPINLPSVTSIEELRTPAFDELLKSFWDLKSGKQQANGDVKHFNGQLEGAQSVRDPRLPLTAIN